MKIDGRAIAQRICDSLKDEVERLQKAHVAPHLAILTLGDDPATVSYIGQKKKKGEMIGAKISVNELSKNISSSLLKDLINKLNNNPAVHGIVVQRPLSQNLLKIVNTIDSRKDIDGLNPNSPFMAPVAESVFEILKEIYKTKYSEEKVENFEPVLNWIRNLHIVVVGKGETGGKPIIDNFKKLDLNCSIVDSKTSNKNEEIKSGDIVVSAVGKKGVVTKEDIKEEAIVIGVGMYKGGDGNFYGDYDENEIADIASFYTPIPGGVGPVNVAMLLKNLVTAAENAS